MDFTTLFIGLIGGLIGYGYIMYGRKQHNPIPLAVGITQCVIPYFIHNPVIAIIVIVGLMFVPKYVKI